MLEQFSNLLADLGSFLAQAPPPPIEDYELYPPQPQMMAPTFSFGQIIAFVLIGIAANVLFGFWAKSKAEEHGINPWVGFAAGFFFAYLGVRIVPLLRPDRLVNTTHRRPSHMQPPMGTNPTYRPAGAPPPDMHPPPVQPNVPQPAYAPTYPPPPQHPMQAAYPPVAAEPYDQVVTADADGYFKCPACSARVKAGRRACMTCGGPLPNVFDPTTL
ncbi:MAG: hypothetical protein IPK87_05530 [Planctomycetes bacterium]|nr:hypothetical protein [Planctomycetota bacterium]